ncbi:MAG: 1-acyl-sn-glycerol-3-phosphate acyltransferase [Phycisphaeraceae bacterium]|nr:1-acyl-sn-glycerol-3-phosphate acyltransferase [Phycisphaeraceae bacterium]
MKFKVLSLAHSETFLRRFWWMFFYMVLATWMWSCYRLKVFGSGFLPRKGGTLFLCNHQSYLDPIAVGVAIRNRPFYSLARSTLFRFPIFGPMIRSTNSIPVEQGQADLAAMRQGIEVLKNGQAVLIFPEGTRSLDGRIGPFASGIMLLIKRARPTVVPVVVDGAQKLWPRGRKLPKPLGRMAVSIGQPIAADTLVEMGAQGALNFLRDKIDAMKQELADKY